MDLMCLSYFLTTMWITWCNRQPRLKTPNKGQIGEIASSIQSTGQCQFDQHLNVDVQWALTDHPPPIMQRLERQLSQPEKIVLNKNLRPTKDALAMWVDLAKFVRFIRTQSNTANFQISGLEMPAIWKACYGPTKENHSSETQLIVLLKDLSLPNQGGHQHRIK